MPALYCIKIGLLMAAFMVGVILIAVTMYMEIKANLPKNGPTKEKESLHTT